MKLMKTVIRDLTRDCENGEYNLHELTELKKLVDKHYEDVKIKMNKLRENYYENEKKKAKNGEYAT